MRKLFYMGLESYEARYTLQLQEWNERVFKQKGVDYVVVMGEELTTDKKIVTGSVLDAHGRSYFSLMQTANLIKMMKQGEVTSEDVIFYEDMFTPGIECLPYIMDQCPDEYRPKVFVRCLAQTIDPDDFVNREGMFDWLRPYELMMDNFVTGIIAASEEMAYHLRIAGFKSDIYISGLPYGKEEVLERVRSFKDLKSRSNRVSFAARWDDEKQPHFYMDLAEAYYAIDPTVEFCICCGHDELKSNRQEYVDRAYALQNSNTANFKVYSGLKKNDYYAILADSKIMFNCALQDWVSNTVSEADTLGAVALYPAYRSFPEVFANNESHLYIPWSLDSALQKIQRIITDIDICEMDNYIIGHISDYQNGTIGRTVDILRGEGEEHARNTLDYRKYSSRAKY